MRTCFIHVGAHKTGTTAIQVVLSQCADELRRHGFLYPRTARSEGVHGHHNIAWEVIRAEVFRRENGNIDDLIAEIGETDDDIILSSEDFGQIVEPHRLKEFVARLRNCGLRVKLVIYLRNQINYIQSLYLEGVQHGSAPTFSRFLETSLGQKRFPYEPGMQVLHYDDILNHLYGIVGPDLIVRSYDKAIEISLISDFFGIFGLTPGKLNVDTNYRINQLPPLRELFELFYVERLSRPLEHGESLVIDCVFNALSGSTISLSEASKCEIIKRFERSNARASFRYALPEFKSMRPVKDSGRKSQRSVCLEDIFSADLQYLVYDLGRAISLQLDALKQERDEAVHTRNLTAEATHILLNEKRGLLDERDAAIDARISLAERADHLVRERDEELRQREALIAQCNTLRDELTQSQAQGNALKDELTRCQTQRDAFAAERDRAIEEACNLRNTLSWRVSDSMRKLRSHLK